MRNACFITGLYLLSLVSGNALAQISCDLDNDGDIDRIDIDLMIDGNIANGASDVLAVRRCVVQCSLPDCEANTPPVANAGSNQTAFFDDLVTLDGTGSTDIDGDSLTYHWSLTTPGGSTAVLSDPTAPRPTFQVDGTLGDAYTATLIVNDGAVDSQPSTVTINIGNTAPVANAGPDQTAFFDDLVTLDGTGSTDVNGDPLTYRWSLTVPAGSTAVLSDPAAPRPTFQVDGTLGDAYTATLIVNDGTVDSAPDTVTINLGNTPPVANAGPDQTAFFDDLVTLDGTGSTDVNGDALTYRWSLSTPAGSTAVLSDPAAPRPTFQVDGTLGDAYVAQLIVNDGAVDSQPSTVTINIGNTAPVANAGPNQVATFGDRVTLDGTGSTDVDGDSLTYRWSLTTPTDSTARLSDLAAPRPTFQVDASGLYVARLIVNDGTVDSAPDTVTINIGNTAPVANAGSNQTAFYEDLVIIDGTGSTDVDGDSLTYRWSLTVPAGSTAVLSDPTAPRPTFLVDGTPGEAYVAQLIVNDGTVDSEPSTVTISIDNTAPVANAGPDQTAFFGDLVTLDGTGSSDVNGDPLTYRWSLTTKPAGSEAMLSDPTAPRPTFQVDGSPSDAYVAQLIVNDGTVDSPPDTVTITVSGIIAPVANAGPDQVATFGDLVTLDGTGSSDVNGDPLTYRWSLTTPPGRVATLSDPTATMPTFQIDGGDLGDVYVAQLIVNDGTMDSAPDTVAVTADLVSGSPNPALSNMTSNSSAVVASAVLRELVFVYRADYVDLTGDVSSNAVVRVNLRFSDGGTDAYISDPFFNTITGDGFSGTVTADNCLNPGSSSWVDVTLTIQDDAGNQSNPVTRRLFFGP